MRQICHVKSVTESFGKVSALSHPVPASFRILLIQVRDDDDPMKPQEVECFRWAMQCERGQMDIFDLTAGEPLTETQLRRSDLVVIGGSGNYSVAQGGSWWNAAADNMARLHDRSRPLFASCWGFQALAQALGGTVVTDPSRAEVGTIEVFVTEAAHDDPVFQGVGPTLLVQSGHQDIVETLPDDAVSLASSDRVTHQAFTFPDKPIYGTQFHPELNREALIERVRAYPQYVEEIAGMSVDEFIDHCEETPDSVALLRRFIAVITQ